MPLHVVALFHWYEFRFSSLNFTPDNHRVHIIRRAVHIFEQPYPGIGLSLAKHLSEYPVVMGEATRTEHEVILPRQTRRNIQSAPNDRFVGGLLRAVVDTKGAEDPPISKYVDIPSWCREYLRSSHQLQPGDVDDKIVLRMVLCLDYFYNMHKKNFDAIVCSAIAKKRSRGRSSLKEEDFDTTLTIPSYDINVYKGLVYPRPRNGRASYIPMRAFAKEEQPVDYHYTTQFAEKKSVPCPPLPTPTLTITVPPQKVPVGPSSAATYGNSATYLASTAHQPSIVTDLHRGPTVSAPSTVSTSATTATTSTSQVKLHTPTGTFQHAISGSLSFGDATADKIIAGRPMVPMADLQHTPSHSTTTARYNSAVPNTCVPKPVATQTAPKTTAPVLGESSSVRDEIRPDLKKPTDRFSVTYPSRQANLAVYRPLPPTKPPYLMPTMSSYAFASSWNRDGPFFPWPPPQPTATDAVTKQGSEFHKPQGTFNNVARHDDSLESDKHIPGPAKQMVTVGILPPKREVDNHPPSDLPCLGSPTQRSAGSVTVKQESRDEVLPGADIPDGSIPDASDYSENQEPTATSVPVQETVSATPMVPSKRKRKSEVSLSSYSLRSKGNIDSLSKTTVNDEEQEAGTPIPARRSGRLAQKEIIMISPGTGETQVSQKMR